MRAQHGANRDRAQFVNPHTALGGPQFHATKRKTRCCCGSARFLSNSKPMCGAPPSQGHIGNPTRASTKKHKASNHRRPRISAVTPTAIAAPTAAPVAEANNIALHEGVHEVVVLEVRLFSARAAAWRSISVLILDSMRWEEVVASSTVWLLPLLPPLPLLSPLPPPLASSAVYALYLSLRPRARLAGSASAQEHY